MIYKSFIWEGSLKYGNLNLQLLIFNYDHEQYQLCYSYNPGWVWYPCESEVRWVLYECIWVITGLLPKRLYQSMLSLWTASNGFRLCSPIKASFGTNNIFLWFFSQVISTYHPRTDIYYSSVLWLVISDISQYKTLWCMVSLDNKWLYHNTIQLTSRHIHTYYHGSNRQLQNEKSIYDCKDTQKLQ